MLKGIKKESRKRPKSLNMCVLNGAHLCLKPIQQKAHPAKAYSPGVTGEHKESFAGVEFIIISLSASSIIKK